jgi:hypothetical protein
MSLNFCVSENGTLAVEERKSWRIRGGNARDAHIQARTEYEAAEEVAHETHHDKVGDHEGHVALHHLEHAVRVHHLVHGVVLDLLTQRALHAVLLLRRREVVLLMQNQPAGTTVRRSPRLYQQKW